ncbi:uncharacterized protein CXorf58-like [Haliotis cracherodii]|uniref:uncharacterized protein CXorf58-like n=1 Tax=Haliotis cracherodii TaxID=6455 RepID=UPI0039ECF9E4
MSESPESRRSEQKSVSRTSRTSISVKLPSASSGDGYHKSRSPDRASTCEGKLTPLTPKSHESKFSVSLEGREFVHTRPAPTPTSAQTLSPSPIRSLRHGAHNQRELIRQAAASIIERAWIAFRDRQMFCLLKHSICAAENSLSHEILRKVCPKEAVFLKDKSLQIKVRFRFGGSEFPPMIFFKIFYNTDGKGIKYISGKKMIKPASEAAEDSLRLMGNRLFYEQMLQDSIFQQQYNISDEVDVTTLKDYMQYLANVDETPAYMGGKENYWRKLTLDVLPRHTIFYDVIEYAYNNKMTPRLQEELPLLVSRPVTQEIQVEQLRSIGLMRTPLVPMPTPKSGKMSALNPHISGRRSKKAISRAVKMRMMLGLDGEGVCGERAAAHYVDCYNPDGELPTQAQEDWEHEASKLYEWTQELSFNDEAMATPRLLLTS